ncbi:MAG: YdcF family protein [Alphaproteobacteria bacterium]|nr:YdcF family protein [Alphaproteobacteria bacterium]
MGYSTEKIAEVNNRLFAPFRDIPNKKTGIALLFGGRSTSGTIARTAAEEYHNRRFPKIMVAGGAIITQPEVFAGLLLDKNKAVWSKHTLRDIFTLKTEADYMKQVLLENDVPEGDIIIGDNRKKHANQIVEALKEQLMQEFDSATIMTYAPYLRRSIGTLRFQEVEMPLVGYPVNPFGLNPDNWHQSKLASLVVRESDNMNPLNRDGYVGTYTTTVYPEYEKQQQATLLDFSKEP